MSITNKIEKVFNKEWGLNPAERDHIVPIVSKFLKTDAASGKDLQSYDEHTVRYFTEQLHILAEKIGKSKDQLMAEKNSFTQNREKLNKVCQDRETELNKFSEVCREKMDVCIDLQSELSKLAAERRDLISNNQANQDEVSRQMNLLSVYQDVFDQVSQFKAGQLEGSSKLFKKFQKSLREVMDPGYIDPLNDVFSMNYEDLEDFSKALCDEFISIIKSSQTKAEEDLNKLQLSMEPHKAALDENRNLQSAVQKAIFDAEQCRAALVLQRKAAFVDYKKADKELEDFDKSGEALDENVQVWNMREKSALEIQQLMAQ